MAENPKVFISYSHQNPQYEEKILQFSDKLRSEGIDANVDLYEEAPTEGWPRWMENQIQTSDYVLIVCSKSYYDKFYSDEKGKGVTWEVNIVYQLLYSNFSETSKFIPIFFDKGEDEFIPTPLKSFTYYNVGSKDEYEKLYWRLRGVVKNQRPPLGELRPLPEKTKKTMFFSSPIDLEKWNNAHWKGMIYLFQPGAIPVLGLLFENYKEAVNIFKQWKSDAGDNFADDFLKVDYIVPPFPKDCWVYSERDRSYGKGYFVHIGPNVDESIKRAEKTGIEIEDLFLASLSRYQWMDELNGSHNRDLFKRLVDDGVPYLLLPIGIRDLRKPIAEKNLIIDFDYAVKMKNITFAKGMDLKEDNIRKVVLKPADNS